MKEKIIMNRRIFASLALLLILVSSACTKQEFLVIDERLQPYFERFQEEAALRGVEIDFEEMEIEGILETLEGVGGQCEHNSAKPDRVLIDLTYWTQASELDKEFIVFHELGHCALDRSHLDDENADGTCLSMMHSGSAGCRNVYSPDTRDTYLAELFK